MAEHGGYRKPAHPAPVSGPGAHSRRTDGGPAQVISSMGGQAYGQRSADVAAQQAAPMAGTQPLPSPAQVSSGQQGQQDLSHPQQYSGGEFDRPTDRPNEPVTAGADMGAGPGPEVLNVATPSPDAMPTGAMTRLLTNLSATDTTGVLASLLQAAQAVNA